MGGGGKGGTSTTTVSIPPEVLARYNAVNARAEQVAQTPFQPYGGEFVAPLTGTQQAGVDLTQQYAQAAQPYYGTAAGMTTGAAQAAQPYYSAATGITGAALAGEQPGYQQAFGMTTGAAGAAQPLYGAATGVTGAALSGLQPGYQQALGMTTGAAGAAQPFYGAAELQTLAASQPLSAQQIARYQSPYTQAVVDPTLQALRQQQGIDLARQQAQQIQTGAYGGDRAGLSRAMLQGQQQLAQAQAIAPLYQQAYQNALQTAQQQQQTGLAGAQQLGALAGQQLQGQLTAGQQIGGLTGQQYQNLLAGGQQLGTLAGQQLQGQLTAGQQLGTLTGQQYANALSAAQQLAGIGGQQLTGQLSAAQQLAGIGTGAQQAGLQGAQAVIGAGTLGQQTQQALDTARYQQFLQERGYPFQIAQFLANIAEGTGALSGSTTTSTQPTAWFSDERLKTDIKKIATAKNGLPIYSFKYKDDPKTTHIGFIAQDVEKKHPEAVGLSGGYKTVDYGKALREARAMGGGLLPSSMGGGVWPANDRQDFAGGGGPMSLQDILAQQHAFQSGQDPSASPSLPYAGMAQKGLGIPMQKSPAARAGLMKASPPPQQPSGLQTAMQNIASAGKTAETLSGGYDVGKKWLTGTPAVTDPKTGQVTQKATSGLAGYGGEWGKSDPNATKTDAGSPPPADTQRKAEADIFPKDDTEFVAYGGGIKPRIHASSGSYIDPYKPATSESMIPEDVMEDSESTKDKAEGQAIKPDGSRGGGGGGGGLGSALGTVSGLYGAAKGIGSLLSFLPFFETGGRVRYYNGGLVPRHGYQTDGTVQSDQAPQYKVQPIELEQMPDYQQALLKEIYGPESGGKYNIRYGGVGSAGKTFDVTGPHPNIPERRDDGRTSTAAGAGQFLGSTWQDITGGAPMLPGYQNAATLALAQRDYKARTGRDLDADLQERGVTPEIKSALAPTWESFAKQGYGKQVAQQGYPFQKQIEGGLGAAKDFTSSLVPLTYKGEERKGGWGDFLTSRDFILPLMAGLGTMASSPSRYLGAAILQGLGGAAQAYQGVQNQQIARDQALASTAQTEALTRGVDISNLQKSLQQTQIGNIVWLKNGTFISGTEYQKRVQAGQAPELLGSIPPNANKIIEQTLTQGPPMPSGGVKPAGQIEEAAPPAPTAPTSPGLGGAAPTKAPAKETLLGGANYGDASKAAAIKDAAMVDPVGGATIGYQGQKDISDRYNKSVSAGAQVARDTQKLTREVADNLATVIGKKGLNAPGAFADQRGQFINVLNTTARSLGLPAIDDALDDASTKANKLRTLLASVQASGAGGETLGYFNALANAVAQPNMPQSAGADLAAQLMVYNKRLLDRDTHRSRYAQDSNGVFTSAGTSFEQENPTELYDKQEKILANILKNDPRLFRDLSSQKYSADQIEKLFQKQFGVNGMSAYFKGGI